MVKDVEESKYNSIQPRHNCCIRCQESFAVQIWKELEGEMNLPLVLMPKGSQRSQKSLSKTEKLRK